MYAKFVAPVDIFIVYKRVCVLEWLIGKENMVNFLLGQRHFVYLTSKLVVTCTNEHKPLILYYNLLLISIG